MPNFVVRAGGRGTSGLSQRPCGDVVLPARASDLFYDTGVFFGLILRSISYAVHLQVPPEMKQPRPDPRNPSRGATLPPAAGPSARFDPRVRSASGMMHISHNCL